MITKGVETSLLVSKTSSKVSEKTSAIGKILDAVKPANDDPWAKSDLQTKNADQKTQPYDLHVVKYTLRHRLPLYKDHF